MLHCRFKNVLNTLIQSCKDRRVAIALTKLDDDGTLIYANPEFRRLSGYHLNEAVTEHTVQELLIGNMMSPWKHDDQCAPASVFATQCRDINANLISALSYYRPLYILNDGAAGLMTIGRFLLGNGAQVI